MPKKFIFTVNESPKGVRSKKKKSHSGVAKNRRRKDRLWERHDGFISGGRKWTPCVYCVIPFTLTELTGLMQILNVAKGNK